MAFPVGIIIGSLTLLARRSLHRKGQALLLALAACGSCIAVMAVGLPFWGLVLATVAWKETPTSQWTICDLNTPESRRIIEPT